ncbi:CRAL-TRIO domain-containing protein [Forsythia ovata]|uniref:CRAL-TRIO domain-containing protein n=1 Tax=Forsythia ovata TaxID=205694 RepID=A0ABD1T8L5_9LAMI
MNSNSILSQFEQQKLIQKLEIFKIQGRDKCGNTVLSIIGKHFPGKLVSAEAIKTYLEHEVFPRLGERLFAIVLYWKVRYMNRLKYLWDNVRRKEIEIPEFIYEYEEQLEYQYPTMEYGLESDHPRANGAPRTCFQVRRPVRKSIGDRVGESEASSRSDEFTYSDSGEISKVEARRSSREENCDDSVEVIVEIIPIERIRVEGAKDLPNEEDPEKRCFDSSGVCPMLLPLIGISLV